MAAEEEEEVVLWHQVLYVSSLAVLGSYIRIVLTGATPAGFADYLSSQLLGSLIMGMAVKTRAQWNVNLYIGTTVGFCGSLTTFSAWQGQVAANVMMQTNNSNAGFLAYKYLHDQLVGFVVPYCALMFGIILASNSLQCVVTINLKQQRDVFDTIPLLFTMLALLGVVLPVVFAPGVTAYSLCFAPFGALLRFVLGRALNCQRPYGTFVANVVGTLLWGAMWDLQHYVATASQPVCIVLFSVQHGFCGALTTVSSFVNEIYTLPHHSCMYALVSIITTQLLLFALMGSLAWPNHYEQLVEVCQE